MTSFRINKMTSVVHREQDEKSLVILLFFFNLLNYLNKIIFFYNLLISIPKQVWNFLYNLHVCPPWPANSILCWLLQASFVGSLFPTITKKNPQERPESDTLPNQLYVNYSKLTKKQKRKRTEN